MGGTLIVVTVARFLVAGFVDTLLGPEAAGCPE